MDPRKMKMHERENLYHEIQGMTLQEFDVWVRVFCEEVEKVGLDKAYEQGREEGYDDGYQEASMGDCS